MATTKTTKASAAKTKAPKAPKPAKIQNLDVSIYNQDGKSVSTFKAPEHIFGIPWNADLVHQVVTSMRSSARGPVAHAKDRGEVRGGGKKPWKQKGTGRARHGSTRSPIWVGGGVAHGPRNDKSYDRKVNRKMKAKAIYTILSQKLRDGEILFVNSFDIAEAKTKSAKAALEKLGSVSGYEMLSKRRNNAALVTSPAHTLNTKRGFRNMGNLEIMDLANINPLALLQYKYLVMISPEDSIKTLEAKMK